MCAQHDPSGVCFRGQWHCHSCCRQQRAQAAPSVQEECHRLIIDDHSGDASPSASEKPPSTTLVAGGGGLPALLHAEDEDEHWEDEGGDDDAEDEDEDWEDEGGDYVLPLKEFGSKAKAQHRLDRGHVVLLLDASGSMRTCDAEADAGPGGTKAMLSRIDAAQACAMDFISKYVETHPNDVFSIGVFSDTVKFVCSSLGARKATEALAATGIRGCGPTNYLSALTKAAKCLKSQPGAAAHVVLLSDGRPGDAKPALQFFQEHFIWGPHAGARLHGIALGSSAEGFAALQQLTCISGGTFVLASCSTRGLSDAFASVTSSITSIREEAVQDRSAPRRPLRRVDFEQPEIGAFGKKGVCRFRAVRSSFSFNGQAFEKQEWAAGSVERRQRPYMRGGMRLVYGFNDSQVVEKGSCGWMVAKTSRFADPALSAPPVVEAHAKSTAVARHFAGLFHQRCAAARHPARLIFVPCFVYTTEAGEQLPAASKPDARGSAASGAGEPSAFAAERYLPGAFLKYNSNNGYVGESSLLHFDAVQAFLHFSFESSGGNLAVTDLQGVARCSEVLLTDPQVLTIGQGGIFGPGDLGARGLRACLAAHRCGPTCRKLGLTPISGPMLRRLGASATRRQPAQAHPASTHSIGSWQHLGSDGNPNSDWEAMSEGMMSFSGLEAEEVRSSHTSGSSWVHVL